MTLDRTTTPPVGTFPPLSLPAPGIHALSNGIEIIACNRGDEDVCRIDLMFEGGYYTEQKPGTAALTLLMLKEGAAGKSGISTPAYLCWQTSLHDPISRKKNSPGSKNGVSNNCSFRKKK